MKSKSRKRKMDTKLGERLLESIDQATRFLKGEEVPGVRVTFYAPSNVREIRTKMKLDQREFAEKFGLSLDSVRNWEQGRRAPDGPAKVLLAVIAKHPKAVTDALADYR